MNKNSMKFLYKSSSVREIFFSLTYRTKLNSCLNKNCNDCIYLVLIYIKTLYQGILNIIFN